MNFWSNCCKKDLSVSPTDQLSTSNPENQPGTSNPENQPGTSRSTLTPQPCTSRSTLAPQPCSSSETKPDHAECIPLSHLPMGCGLQIVTPDEPFRPELYPATGIHMKTVKVKTHDGPIRGRQYENKFNDTHFFGFLGVPYAEPPVGPLRFLPPRPKRHHRLGHRTLNAFGERQCCKQICEKNKITGNEDCLYLNIYCPRDPTTIPKESRLPVLVFFHGGGHMVGTNHFTTYTPWNMMRENLIWVTVAYRLNIFGFLNMGTEDCQGNCGLKDQVMALRWIQQNIKAFGGNCDNVTISGGSAGAAHVNFHMISPMSKGLFHKTILQSGNVFCPWGVVEHTSKIGFRIARELGYRGNTREGAVLYLKRQTADSLIEMCVHVIGRLKWESQYSAKCFLGPTIENIINEETFLPALPEKLMQTATPVPTLMGINSKEGRLIFKCTYKFVNQFATQNLTNLLTQNFGWDVVKMQNIPKEMKRFYFKENQPTEEPEEPEDEYDDVFIKDVTLDEGVNVTEQLVDLYTDIFFHRMYDSVGFVIASEQPVYMYLFDFNGSYNLSNITDKKEPGELSGASHADEIPYLYPSRKMYLEAELGEKERIVRDNLCSMWGNFVHTGKPKSNFDERIRWKPHKTVGWRYLQISDTEPYFTAVKDRIYTQRFAFMSYVVTRVNKAYKKNPRPNPFTTIITPEPSTSPSTSSS